MTISKKTFRIFVVSKRSLRMNWISISSWSVSGVRTTCWGALDKIGRQDLGRQKVNEEWSELTKNSCAGWWVSTGWFGALALASCLPQRKDSSPLLPGAMLWSLWWSTSIDTEFALGFSSAIGTTGVDGFDLVGSAFFSKNWLTAVIALKSGWLVLTYDISMSTRFCTIWLVGFRRSRNIFFTTS